MKPKFTLLLFSVLLGGLFGLKAQNLPQGAVCSDPVSAACGQTYTGFTTGIPNDNASANVSNCLGAVGTGGQYWYAYSGSETSQITVSTCGSSFDTRIHVFSGSCGSLTCVAQNDDGCSMQSLLTFTAEAGVNYLIRVGGFGPANGTFNFSVSCGSYVSGCTDPNASNYDPLAVVNDGSCVYEGCTDSGATNYDPSATVDDGSCQYCNGEGSAVSTLYVCTFSNGAAVNLSITDSNGNEVISLSGLGNNVIQYFSLCLSAGECYSAVMTNANGGTGWNNGYFWINSGSGQVINESLNANLSEEVTIFSIDGTCASIPGCTNPEAFNYNAEANTDDGSCVFVPECNTGVNYSLNLVPGSFPSEVSYSIIDANGAVVYESSPLTSNLQTWDFICLQDGCYTILMEDSFGDGWNGGWLYVSDGNSQSSYTITTGDYAFAVISVNAEGCQPNIVSGCTNPQAENYNPAALFDDGSCLITGCTDPSAMNYNASATVDNGSCTYCNGEGSVMANLYICAFANAAELELQIVDDQGNEVYYAYGMNNYGILNTQICLQPGVCYTANMVNNVGPNGWYNGYFWVNNNGVELVHTGLAAGLQYASVNFSIDGTCGPIPGCTDPAALNYDPEASINDGSCQYAVAGCTDPAAINYNSAATFDDNSCVYPEFCEGTFVTFNFVPGTFVNEGSYTVIDANGNILFSAGGGNPLSYACLADGCYSIYMYDTFGDGWDGGGSLTLSAGGVVIGTYTLGFGLDFGVAGFGINTEGCVNEVSGCTDPSALNYNPAATSDDGSCTYPEDCNENLTYITIATQSWGSEVSWNLVGADGVTYASGSGYTSWGYFTQAVCLPDGCYEMQMADSWGDGWNGGYYYIQSTNSYYEGSLLYGDATTDLIGINSDCGLVAGCMDANAVNYNPNATYDDGSCVYNNGNGAGFDNGLELEYALYPNPANSGIVIYLNNLDQDASIMINFMSPAGQLVRTENISNNEVSRQLNLDVSELAAGCYFVQVLNGQDVHVLPLIKQ